MRSSSQDSETIFFQIESFLGCDYGRRGLELNVVVAFFSHAKNIFRGVGGRLEDSFPTCAFFKLEINSRLPFPFFYGRIRNETSWDDCDRVYPDGLHVSSVSAMIGSHTLSGQHSQPTPTSLGQGCVRVEV